MLLASILVCLSATTCFVDALAKSNSGHPLQPARPLLFEVPLRIGDRIEERADQNDQIEWKLPKKRLERFRNAGVIITEERRIATILNGVVVHADARGAAIQVHGKVTSFDVPRNTVTTTALSFRTSVEPDNEPSPSKRLDVYDSAAVGLPITTTAPGYIGQRWRTHLAVITPLGSGMVTFDHVISNVSNGLAEIAIAGRGEITGTEMHLPKLLPGSIEVKGTAWYDIRSGFVTQESYFIHNQLLKPAEGEQIGFDERLTVDVRARRSKV